MTFHHRSTSQARVRNRVRSTIHGLYRLAILASWAGAVLTASAAWATDKDPSKHDPHRWDKQIAAFEKADQETMPPRNGILFVGSSSIRHWNLQKSFPGKPVINRGFGGSEISDSLFFADRIIIKHQPRIIVFYAGDNDLAGGKSSARVVKDYQAFVKKIRGSLPQTRIIFVAIKPSIARWKLINPIRQANQEILEITKTDPLQVFLDIDGPMIGSDGKPKPELFIKDGLHLNVAGYQLWNSLIRPHLD
ncbi:MAG: SGNH/GDSL hydrolase family protein [Pirellulaceae bacterium]